MKFRILIFFTLCLIILNLFDTVPKAIAANSACSPDSQYCELIWTDYLETTYCTEIVGGYPTRVACGTNWVRKQVCSVSQSGGGSCVCCTDSGGCYLDCGAPAPTSGGGGGGGGGGATCGDGSCDAGESCSSCPGDCGSCSSPQYCGDASCNNGETCATCSGDCGVCTGTVQMRAAVVPSGTNTCSGVTSSTNYTPVDITLFSEGETKTTGSDGTYTTATWTNSPSGTKSFADYPPSGYVLAFACYNTTSQPAYSSGYTATLPTGETLTWQLGYTAGVGWFQAQGGDVYAATQLRSYIPASAVGGRYALKDANTGGTPGVVTFGSSADFDSSTENGYGYVSTKNWLVNETLDTTDYYAVLYHRFGSPTTADYAGGSTITAKPTSRTEPYYVNGDLIVDTADWSVGNGETLTFLVNGSLTLNKKINISGTGFVAFIVNGDITVGSGVGTTATSSTPVIEGMYITSSSGTFRTGSSTTAASRRFVGKGTFVAGTFALQRDLDADTHNIDYAAELFIYNPELMLRMPEKMKDLPVSWQEVAP